MKMPFGGEDITVPVDVPNIPDPQPGTGEYECALARDKSTYSVSAMPWLPQLPETWAQELHDRIEEAERTYAAPNMLEADYLHGTATEPDEVAEIDSLMPGYLFTAEHATKPTSLKTGKPRFADTGTGGLAAVLGEDYGMALIMRGRQTSNVPSDPGHPIKPYIRRKLAHADGFVGVHGKNPGMFVHPSDRVEIHACIGLGLDPTDKMRDFAHTVIRAARDDLGLYVVLSNDQPAYIQKPGSTELKREEDGTVKLSQLAATEPRDPTVSFSRAVLNNRYQRDAPVMQMELTDLLRATPHDREGRKDRVSRIIGVAMGYKLLEKVVELTPGYAS